MRLILGLLLAILFIGGVQAAQPSTAPDPEQAVQSDGSWQAWTLPVNLSHSPADPPQAAYPTLGVDASGQQVYVAWSDGEKGAQDIYYASSQDGGYNWGGAQLLADTGWDSSRPSLTMAGTVPMIAWSDTADGDQYTTYEMALGAGSPNTVPNDNPYLASAPQLAWGSDNELHLALQGGANKVFIDILYSHRPVGTTAWPAATIVATHQAIRAEETALAVSDDGKTIHLVWQETFSGNQSQIFYRQGVRDGGDPVWNPPTNLPAVNLSQGITLSVQPDIAVGGGAIHVVWGEGVDRDQYVGYRSCSETQDCTQESNWSTYQRVDPQPVRLNSIWPVYLAPSVAISPASAICVAWEGYRLGAIPNEEILLSCSADGGASWGTPVNLSHSSDMSIRPVLAIGDDGILHAAWQEKFGTNPSADYETYYAHSLPHVVFLPLSFR